MSKTVHKTLARNKKSIGFLFVFLLVSAHIFAQKFTAQVSKNKLAVGEVFQLTFTINASASNFKAPNLTDYDVYSGPNQSTSMQIINGNMSQSISLSYLLSPKKEGKFTIGAASIVVSGTKLESNSIVIEVKGSAQQSGGTSSNSNKSNPPTNTQGQYSSANSDDDLFIKTFVSKKSCYLGEQIVVTQKVYSRLNLRGFQNYKMPVFNGFWSQNEDNRNKQIQLQTENLDGIQYYVAEFTKSYLFPQRSGSLTLEPMEVDCIVRQRSSKQPQNIFDQFFGGGYEDKVVKAKSKPVTIDVKALPEAGKPANFNGAVGNFSLKTELSKEKVVANQSVNLKLSITGKGNIKLTDAPKINFPEGFETFEPKVNENYSEGGSFSGTKTYDYLIIPRQAGDFTIKDLGFSYFDPEKKSYVTVPAPEFNINVSPDPNAVNNEAQVYSPKNTIEEKQNDIRYLKSGDLNLKPNDELFFSSWKHYLLLALPVLAFIGFIGVSKNISKRNSDVVAVKGRKAAKLAKKHLTAAEKFKNSNNKDAFYHEVFVALNGYVGDKLNIPVADLNKQNIETHLLNKQVSTETIKKLLDTLNDCEVARYAPAAVTAEINTVYNNTAQLIETIENEARS
ncbi:MAG: BatD family protein [Bacteroidota bacterium]|nr:BatD family protein [Bacteroidota bacterium]